MYGISFFNLPYPFRKRFVQLLPSKTCEDFIQTSSTTLKEFINVCQISANSSKKYYTHSNYKRIFLSNNQSINFEIRNHLITLYCNYKSFNDFKFHSVDELVLKLDRTIINDAIDVYEKFSFIKLTIVIMKEFDFGVFFENVLLNRKFDYLKVYGYISAEYLFKISSQLLKFKSVQLKNLNPAFPILNLKILQKFYASILQSPKHECSKFEIVQIDPNENVINVLALENERYILHSYFQPKSDTPFLFYE